MAARRRRSNGVACIVLPPQRRWTWQGPSADSTAVDLGSEPHRSRDILRASSVTESSSMRLCRFASAGEPALGIVEGEEIVDLSASGLPAEPALALAEAGRDGLERLAVGAP